MTTPTDRPSRFLFISGRLCLDFVHTGGAGERQVFEAWHAPHDLAEWFADSALHLADVIVSSADLERAYALREAIWHAALACLQQESLPPASLLLINQMAREPDIVPQIDAEQHGTVWEASVTCSAALSAVARDAIALFTGDQAALLRQCANPRCILLFVDASRPGKRRWCSMERCGNRAKVATYRKQKAGSLQGE